MTAAALRRLMRAAPTPAKWSPEDQVRCRVCKRMLRSGDATVRGRRTDCIARDPGLCKRVKRRRKLTKPDDGSGPEQTDQLVVRRKD